MSMPVKILEKSEFDVESEPGKKIKVVSITYQAGNLPPRVIYIDKEKLHIENVKSLIIADLYQLLGFKPAISVVGL